MKRHLNTLFVTSEGAYVGREGEQVIVRREEQPPLRVPILQLGAIVLFGRIGFSPSLAGLCGRHGVTLSLLSTYGRFLARVEGPVSGNVLLRREQYRRADEPEHCAALAATFIGGKLVNARTVLRRALRERPQTTGNADIEQVAGTLGSLLKRLSNTHDLDQIRGLEGEGARLYFSVLDHLVLSRGDTFRFSSRSRRPPLDPINALLSFAYTLLTHDVAAALEGVGLDPAVGFLHRDRPGRFGLALDLVEELRPIVADRLVLSLINRRQINERGFRREETGRVVMDEDIRKAFLVAYQERKNTAVTHPFLGERTTIGLVPHLQARLLARHLRGDLDAYPPFIWK
ncbi:MAG: type I-C CRISPR-associated endonuclease Cas1c [Acidobacteriota bacterium]